MEKSTDQAKMAAMLEDNPYEAQLRRIDGLTQRALEGNVVIRGKERPWVTSRQGRLKFFVTRSQTDMVPSPFDIFVHDVQTHSGKHTHQGGLAIYVLEGKGYTVIDGKRLDWEKGDLILLPIKPGGVEHQHFNAETGQPARWLAFYYSHFEEALGNLFRQHEEAPQWNAPRMLKS
jgi:hypothetical protein